MIYSNRDKTFTRDDIALEDVIIDENVDTNDIKNGRQDVYAKGSYAKIDRFCLSINHMCLFQHIDIASFLMPLYLGKCVTHNLSILDCVCTKCGIVCWKAKGKSNL